MGPSKQPRKRLWSLQPPPRGGTDTGRIVQRGRSDIVRIRGAAQSPRMSWTPSKEHAAQIAFELFGITGEASPLVSELGRNLRAPLRRSRVALAGPSDESRGGGGPHAGGCRPGGESRPCREAAVVGDQTARRRASPKRAGSASKTVLAVFSGWASEAASCFGGLLRLGLRSGRRASPGAPGSDWVPEAHRTVAGSHAPQAGSRYSRAWRKSEIRSFSPSIPQLTRIRSS